MKKILATISLLLILPSIALAQFSVPQGGTGKTSFPQNSLIYADGNSLQRLQGTSSPTVGYITATSTTATSTFANGLNLTGGCFRVNGSCIGTSSGGTVTNIGTTYPVLGGPITTTGTLSLAFGTTTSNTWAGTQTFINAPVISAFGVGALYSTSAGLIQTHATTSTSVNYQDVWRDGNGNAFANNFIQNLTNITASGGTTVLTPATPRYAILIGSNNQTYQMPNGNASGMNTGATWEFNNNTSDGFLLTVTDHSGNIITTVPYGGLTDVILTDNGTADGSWEQHALLGHRDVAGRYVAGFGSTTPFARFAIHANNGDTKPMLFAVGSSTASATTTLFTIDNTGLTTTKGLTITNLNTAGVVNNTSSGSTYTTATSTPTVTAPITYSGTLGQFLSGISGAFGCLTASGSVTGCLSSTDWTTFNNKQATISTTWPITLSGATVGFNGLSTSTAAVQGNIPYFSGVNTFANVATTTLSGSGLISVTAGGSVIGSSPITVSCPTCGTGTVTSVTGTYPVQSSGGATPAISLAFGTTTSNTWAGTQTFTNAPTVTAFNTAGTVNNTSSGALYSTATTSFTPSSAFTITGTIGALMGGANSTLDLATNGTALTKLAQVAANTVLGNNTGATGNVVAYATSTLGIALSDTTGTLAIARGGTNATSFTTSGNAVYYDGTKLATAPTTGAVTTPYASTTAMSSSGSAYFVTSGTGSVGIGTTAPVAPLHVVGATNQGVRISGGSSARLTLVSSDNSTNLWNIDDSAGTLRFFRENYSATGAGAGGAIGMTIDDNRIVNISNKLGIASSSPSEPLSVTGNVYATGRLGVGTDNTLSTYSIIGYSTGNASILSQTTAADTAGNALFEVIGGATNADWMIGTNRSDLAGAADSLFIRKNAGTTGQKVVIQDNGNVGLATTSPSQTLSVSGNEYITGTLGIGLSSTANANAKLQIEKTTVGGGTTMSIGNPSNNNNAWSEIGLYNDLGYASRAQILFGSSAYAPADGSTANAFELWNNVSGGNIALMTTGAGNVGIATTTPASKFSVSGSGYITGGLGVGARNNTTGTISATVAHDTIDSTGVYKINGTTVLSASTTPINYFFGSAPGTLQTTMSGTNNIGVGVNDLNANTTGSGNVAFGRDAMLANTTGSTNVAIGYQAFRNATTSGTDNVAIGDLALAGSASVANTGSNNVAIGASALTANTSGSSNIAIGPSALGGNTTGQFNIALGNQALTSDATGQSNTVLGISSMKYAKTGSNNVAIGGAANQYNMSATSTTVIGEEAAQGVNGTSFFQNVTSIGYRSLFGITTADDTTAIGYQAGSVLTSGVQNTLIGSLAGGGLTTGTGNTLIGYNTTVTSGTISNSLAFGVGASVGCSNCMSFGGGGGANTIVGFGTSTPYAKLSVVNSTTGTTTMALVPASSQSANILDIYNTASPAVLTSVISSSGKWGIGTTSPYAALSVVGSTGVVAQMFTATSSAATSTFNGGVDFTAARVQQHTYGSFSYATTSWTGTTTIPLGTAFVQETWKGVQCFTDTGTLNVDFYHTSTHLTLLNASTTVGTFLWTTNGALTPAEKRYVDIGTPASSPTKISCTVDKMLNQ